MAERFPFGSAGAPALVRNECGSITAPVKTSIFTLKMIGKVYDFSKLNKLSIIIYDVFHIKFMVFPVPARERSDRPKDGPGGA